MYLIIGLGNPEPEYSETRHNMGFDTINMLAKEYEIGVNKSKFDGLYGIGKIESEKVLLLKPQTFMNLSGKSLIRFMNFYKISPDNLIVVYDDFDTEVGKIRIRKTGTAGTHKGMISVINELGTQDFTRIRVGIGQPEYKSDIVNFVTSKVSKEEQEALNKGVEKAKKAIVEIIKNNIDVAMNKFN